ncbi:TatD family hydrolase [Desulfurivibrio dismutans]|uniref:TatD family hydrolase n=1 Tax=Desulfurivibrio dismutans TaxID=1398908 RepID=UPI003D65B794
MVAEELAAAELIDTHCHLDFPDYQADLEQVVKRAAQAGVRQMITVGIDLASSRKGVELAEQWPGVFATVGVHPHHVNEIGPDDYQALQELGRHPRVVAYGEIGLDYVKEYSPAPLQREHFAHQVAIARQLELPLVIHDREAHADTLAILREAGELPAGGVMHCFSGDAALAEEVLAMGFYVSIPGVVTFKSAATLWEAVRMVPLERLLLETDAPFLAPVPLRGKRNEPAYLAHIAAKVAELKGCAPAAVARQTTANARRLFNLR